MRENERLPSLREIGASKLRALGRALELRESVVRSAVEIFDTMTSPWSAMGVGDRPPWPNDITDDGTPFEFSVALDGDVSELRMLLESQSFPATTESSWEEGQRLLERLRARGWVSLDRFRVVEDLFRPDSESDVRFCLWHAAVVTDSGRPLFKAYLNPLIRGRAAAPALVKEALARLGLDQAWRFLEKRLGQMSTPDIRYFALDLDDAKSARVKVYVGSSESAAEVEALLVGASNVAPGQATEWLKLLTGRTGPFPTRPILCCFAFASGQERPTATLHVPIRCYVGDDKEAASRVTSLLGQEAAKRLTRTLAAAANRPLGMGRGLLTYASLRPASDRLRVTVYLAPETYAIAAPRRPMTSVSLLADSDAFATPELATFSDVRAETSDRARSFEQQALFALFDGSAKHEVSRLLPLLAWLATFLRDALMVTRDHLDDAGLAAAAARINTEFDSIVGQIQSEVTSRGLARAGDAFIDCGDEQEPVRDWAYSEVGQLLSIADEHARLAAAWAVASLVGLLSRRAIASLSLDPDVSEDDRTAVTERPALPASRPGFGAEIAVPAGASANILDALESATIATRRLASELHTWLLRSVSSGESAAFPLDGRAPERRKRGRDQR